MADVHAALHEQFEAMPQQKEAATLGMWTFLATEVLFFGAITSPSLLYALCLSDYSFSIYSWRRR